MLLHFSVFSVHHHLVLINCLVVSGQVMTSHWCEKLVLWNISRQGGKFRTGVRLSQCSCLFDRGSVLLVKLRPVHMLVHTD